MIRFFAPLLLTLAITVSGIAKQEDQKKSAQPQHNLRKVIFPLAGMGTRLLPATKSVPKEMLPILDIPLLQYSINEAVNSGFEEIIFVTGTNRPVLEDYLSPSPKLKQFLEDKGKQDLLDTLTKIIPSSVKVTFVDQPEPKGLGHAIWCAREHVEGENFAVILADDLMLGETPCLKQMAEALQPGMNAIVAAMEVPEADISKYGIFKTSHHEGRRAYASDIVEKPSPEKAPSRLAAVGRYILTPAVLAALENLKPGAGGEIQLTDAIAATTTGNSLCAYRFEGTRYDCGSKEGLLEATLNLAVEDKSLKAVVDKFVSQRKGP